MEETTEEWEILNTFIQKKKKSQSDKQEKAKPILKATH